jgi:vancomycin resistance protein YoaR
MGVDIGGLGRSEAQAMLDDAADDASSTSMQVVANGNAMELRPDDLGLTIDSGATVDRVTGFSLSPTALWHHVFGSGAVEPVVAVDDAALSAAVDEITTTLARDVANAQVVIGSDGFDVIPGEDGVFVYAPQARRIILGEWLTHEPIILPAVVTPPAWTTEEAERFASAVDQIVLGSPATLSSANGSVPITPEDVLQWGSVVQTGSGFALRMDGAALADEIRERLPGIENAAIDASIGFDVQHQLVINPGAPGRTIDVAALGTAAVEALSTASRTGAIPLVETPAAVTSEDLANSDIKELISSFSTSFTPREPKREHNITNAASRLTGRTIHPGEVLSMANAIGPIDGAHGYVSAGVIVGGVHVNGMGGGLCQIATTTYNAAYYAGLEIVERHAHSEWFDRYPAGRDAALAAGADMRFRNDTPYDILINAYIEDAALHVDFWSTHYYDTETTSSGKFNIRGGYRVPVTTRPCTNLYGKNGFSITEGRMVYLDGELVKNESRTSSYRMVPGVVCS